MSKSLKIVALSDMHGELPKNIQECDVVCICGDIVPLDYQQNFVKSISWFLLDFKPWAETLPCKKVIFIGGNHDFFLQRLHQRGMSLPESFTEEADLTWNRPSTVMKSLLVGNHKGQSKLVYLCDNSYEYEGVTFYGTPWIADLTRWAFYLPEDKLAERYANIPKKLDVLLTHMPPKVANVGTVLQGGWNSLTNYGSEALAQAIKDRDINWSLCGHVHSGNHLPTLIDNTNFVNVSLKDEDYKVAYKPFCFIV